MTRLFSSSSSPFQGFLDLDDAMRTEDCLKDESSGSTAITVLIRGDQLYAGNAGDSRAIACVAGHAQPLSIDHKPDDEAEKARIENAGGFVEFKRVNGNLALSRALGDFAFKANYDLPPEEQIVTACPEVQTCTLTSEWDFLVLACDGIWDVLQNQEVSWEGKLLLWTRLLIRARGKLVRLFWMALL